MSNIVPFNFESNEVRVIQDQDGDHWFVLKDILEAMGSSTTTTNALDSIKQALGGGYSSEIPLQTAGGAQQTIIVAEPAATFLVARSNTEAGKRLNRFIHTDVLPSIRKTGSYSVQASPTSNIQDPVLRSICQLLIETDTIKQQVSALSQQSAVVEQKTAELEQSTSVVAQRLRSFGDGVKKRLDVVEVKLADGHEKCMTITDVAKKVKGRLSARNAHLIAEILGFIERIEENGSIVGWRVLPEGRHVAVQRKEGGPIMWNDLAVIEIEEYFRARPAPSSRIHQQPSAWTH